ncbi:twin-arginine translocation signal domain-containing protein [Halorubrum sp. JWXQ-INN 858]|uniref:cupredoxin domain-containing protein n=1 Tax=Halorubrum sp. JWXQ-INN 858 TaxID=2690782 RepID=UPI00135BE87C|nr:plastocyanin/azurin family copper-binding protein [Halorubrum sp. JWXQ-INN 858]MWV65342.1 twin-arginine translocation signal domain-containing protein [Halorubrum sp. JWXQ-INN 858]
MDRRRFLGRVGVAGVAVGAPLALAGCLDEDHDVAMTADGFVPDEITVPVGGTVVWENTSTRTHTVTAYEGGIPDDAAYFASGGYADEETAREEWLDDFGGKLENGDRFAHTFEVPGRYDYVCIPHEDGGMYATVHVEE